MSREAEVAALPLAVRQAVKREVYAAILDPLDPEDAFDRMMALTSGRCETSDRGLKPTCG